MSENAKDTGDKGDVAVVFYRAARGCPPITPTTRFSLSDELAEPAPVIGKCGGDCSKCDKNM